MDEFDALVASVTAQIKAQLRDSRSGEGAWEAAQARRHVEAAIASYNSVASDEAEDLAHDALAVIMGKRPEPREERSSSLLG